MPLLETIRFQKSVTSADASVAYNTVATTQCTELSINVRSTETDELDSQTDAVRVRTAWTERIKTAYEDSDYFVFRSDRYRITNRQRESNRWVYWTGERVK